jgi:AraC-like DNA-binding protein
MTETVSETLPETVAKHERNTVETAVETPRNTLETRVGEFLKQTAGEGGSAKEEGTEEEITYKICQLRQQGYSLRKIADKVGVSYSKVNRILTNLSS